MGKRCCLPGYFLSPCAEMRTLLEVTRAPVPHSQYSNAQSFLMRAKVASLCPSATEQPTRAGSAPSTLCKEAMWPPPSPGLKALKFAEKHAASGTTGLASHKVNTWMKTNTILEYEAEAKECLHLFPSSNCFVNLKDCTADLTPFFLCRSNTCHRRHPS